MMNAATMHDAPVSLASIYVGTGTEEVRRTSPWFKYVNWD
jgi:hypothetical protein